jgi:hypothetical protein
MDKLETIAKGANEFGSSAFPLYDEVYSSLGGIEGIGKDGYINGYYKTKDEYEKQQEEFERENPIVSKILKAAGERVNPLTIIGNNYIGKGANPVDKILRAVSYGGFTGFVNNIDKAKTMQDTFNKDTIKDVNDEALTGGRKQTRKEIINYDWGAYLKDLVDKRKK